MKRFRGGDGRGRWWFDWGKEGGDGVVSWTSGG